ncbi:MAG: DUF4258 domain-containing protein [Nitrospirota bacterium]
MTVEIIDRQFHAKGVIYNIKAFDKILKILYLSHAIERIKKWGITEETVAEALILPEEVIVGHRNRYIAHRRYGDHLVRAVYEYEGKLPILVTVYFPYTERYFKGGGIYEDQILG